MAAHRRPARTAFTNATMSAKYGSPRAGSRPTNPTAAATVTASTATGNRRRPSSAAGPMTSSAYPAGLIACPRRDEIAYDPPACRAARITGAKTSPGVATAASRLARPATAVIPLIVVTRLRP